MSIIVNKEIIASPGNMNVSIYDTQNKQIDIYDYADERNFIIETEDVSSKNIRINENNSILIKITQPIDLTLNDIFSAIHEKRNIILKLSNTSILNYYNENFQVNNYLKLLYYSETDYYCYHNNYSRGIKFSNDYFEAEMVLDGYVYVWKKQEPLYELPEIDEIPDGVIVVEGATTASAKMDSTLGTTDFVIEFIDDGAEGDTLPSTMITYGEGFVSDALDNLDSRLDSAESRLNNLAKPDWAENDPNSASYILNRPFYEITSTGITDISVVDWTGSVGIISSGSDIGDGEGDTTSYEAISVTYKESISPQVYKVVINDNATYSLEVTELTGGTNGFYGTISNEIEVFFWTGGNNTGSIDIIINNSPYESITSLKVTRSGEGTISTIQKIDAKFLPDTLATKQYVEDLIEVAIGAAMEGYY